MTLDEKLRVITINLEGNTNVCNKFHGKPSNICEDISLKTTTVKLTVGLEVQVMVSGFTLWAPWISLPNFIAIRPIFVEIFQCELKW